jgi:hypothetical protein
MNAWVDEFKTAIKATATPRDKTLVAIVYALPHLSLDQLANLRVGEALAAVKNDLPGQVVQRLLANKPHDAFVFPSRKGKARPARHGLPEAPARPANRVTIWRALQAAKGLQNIRETIQSNLPPVVELKPTK